MRVERLPRRSYFPQRRLDHRFAEPLVLDGDHAVILRTHVDGVSNKRPCFSYACAKKGLASGAQSAACARRTVCSPVALAWIGTFVDTIGGLQ